MLKAICCQYTDAKDMIKNSLQEFICGSNIQLHYHLV